MIKSLAHACLFSQDLQKSLDFYTKVLGLKKKFDFVRQGEWFGFYLEISPTQYLEIFKRREPAKYEHPVIGHLCLEVEDIHPARERLLAHGCKATEAVMGADQTWQVWFHDPDGTPIEFHQYTAESSQFTGRDCEVNWV